MGAGFGLGGLLKLGWAFVVQGGVFADGVVERFDVLEQTQPNFGTGLVLLVVNQLVLQRGEERFHRGVVPAVSFADHAALKAIVFEQLLIRFTGVLAATTVPETVRESARSRGLITFARLPL